MIGPSLCGRQQICSNAALIVRREILRILHLVCGNWRLLMYPRHFQSVESLRNPPVYPPPGPIVVFIYDFSGLILTPSILQFINALQDYV